MLSRREVLIRILALLQRKTLIETKNRTLKCLKWQYSTVRSMKDVSVLTEDGAFALFFRAHPGGFERSRVPTPGNLPSKPKYAYARGSARGSAGGIDWCIKLRLIVMPTNLEYRARERQRKRKSRRQASEAQWEKRRQRFTVTDKKNKETFFCWKNNMKIL